MAELRQLSIDGKRIKEAVEAVENSSAGLEIINGELTIADIPDVSLGTITDTDLQEWMAKGLPIKVDNSCYIPSSITSAVVRYEHVVYAKAAEPATHYLITYNYLQYTKATHSLALERSETISTEQLTAGVGIDITDDTISLVEYPTINLSTSSSTTIVDENKIDWLLKGLPFWCDLGDSQLILFTQFFPHVYVSVIIADGVSVYALRTLYDDNSNTFSIVETVTAMSYKYQHNISFHSASGDGFLMFSFIDEIGTPYTSYDDISVAIKGLGFVNTSNVLVAGGGAGGELFHGVYGGTGVGDTNTIIVLASYCDISTGNLVVTTEALTSTGMTFTDTVIGLNL